MYTCQSDYAKIKSITGYEVLDSRGDPTVMCEVILYGGIRATSIVPSGASKGKYEAVELRDENPLRYCGKGVTRACGNINSVISSLLKDMNVCDMERIDNDMIKADGTPDRSNLGANAILAVSIACLKCAAKVRDIPIYRYIGGMYTNMMPRPMMNILNGGKHASNNIDIQEFMIVPTSDVSFKVAIRQCSEVYHKLMYILNSRNLSTSVGDEGGYAPDLKDDTEAISLILTAIDLAGYKAHEDFMIALDCASSDWQTDSSYVMPKRNVRYSTGEMIKNWINLKARYPIISIEDPLGEDDWAGWQRMTQDMSKDPLKCMLVGDDLFVTNTKRLKKGISQNCANSILIKPNQAGTMSETLDTIRIAMSNGYTCIISHRSGDTEDTFIADLAVGIGAKYVKFGSPARGERTSKYNRLLLIEGELNRYGHASLS